jgi:hypothetical protein
MKNIKSILTAIGLLFVFITGSFAQYPPTKVVRDIVTNPQGFKVGPPQYTGSLYTPGTPGTSDWLVAQWDSPSPLGPFYNNATSVSSNMSRFTYVKNGQTWEMALNGDKSACGAETHLFAAPVTSDTYSTPAFINIQSASLVNNGKKIIHTLNVKPYYYQQFSSPCVTQGMFITSMILKNLDDPYMTVFYQLNLHAIPVSPARNPIPSWFFNGSSRADGAYNKTWGYDDNVTSFGYSGFPAKGQTLYFNADIKAKLRAIISDPKNSIPAAYKNPDRWVLSNHYHGPHMWGGIRSTYWVSGFSLTEESTYCSNC